MLQDTCMINMETSNSYTGLAQTIENNASERILNSLAWFNEKLEEAYPFNDSDRELNNLIIKKPTEAINYRPSKIVVFTEWLKLHSKVSLWGTRTILPLICLSIPSALLASFARYIIGGIKSLTDWPINFINGILPNLNELLQKIFDDDKDHVGLALPLWKPYTDVFYEKLMVVAEVVVFSGSMLLLYKFNLNYLIQRPAEFSRDMLEWGSDTWGRRKPLEVMQFNPPNEPTVNFTIYMLKSIFKPNSKDLMPLLNGKEDIDSILKQIYSGKNSNDDDAIRQIREKLERGLCYLVMGHFLDNYFFTDEELANVNLLYEISLFQKRMEIPLLILPILINDLKNKKSMKLPIAPEDYVIDILAQFTIRKSNFTSQVFHDRVFALINNAERDALLNKKELLQGPVSRQSARAYASSASQLFFTNSAAGSQRPADFYQSSAASTYPP